MPFNPFARRLLFHPLPDGAFEVNLPVETRRGLLAMAEELAEFQTTDSPEIRRLFPTAYADDPEKDAGYQVFARDQLIDGRREAVRVMRDTVEATRMTAEDLSSWMGILNDYRLVLGTMLDVSEDDLGPEGIDPEDIDPEDPATGARILYHELGHLVALMVDALTTSLPEPGEEAPGL